MRPFEGQCFTKFKTISENDLVGLIKEFGIKTSVEDRIPAMLLKSSKDSLLPMYVELINKSLSEGTMDTSKYSVIDPLLQKTGLDCYVRNNYRQVGNLLFFSKLIEGVVKKQFNT